MGNKVIEYVNKLSVVEKSKYYFDYWLLNSHYYYQYQIDRAFSNHITPSCYSFKRDKEILDEFYEQRYKGGKNAIKTFEEYTDVNNVWVHDAGDDWKERNFASKEWITFNPESIYHDIYHSNLNLS